MHFQFPDVLKNIILEYASEYQLLPGIDESKLYWNILSHNSAAIQLLEKYPEKIAWDCLSENPAAIHLLKKHPEKIDWSVLSQNPSIFKLGTNPEIRLLL